MQHRSFGSHPASVVPHSVRDNRLDEVRETTEDMSFQGICASGKRNIALLQGKGAGHEAEALMVGKDVFACLAPHRFSTADNGDMKATQTDYQLSSVNARK